MAGMERIEEVTANRVRAGAVVSSMSQAVQELLSNSVDAGATCIEIKIDLPSYRLSVADNGGGIPADKLQSLVATARATSKARSAEDMQRTCTYGFRGEALYSLGLTSLIEIQSRCAGKESHAKVVREGHALHFGAARAPVRTGTIVTLRDAFFKWPVRRKAANEVTEMLRIKEEVARVALVNNSVAITVIDSAKSKQVVRATATGSITRSFAQLFSSDKLSMARKLTFDFKQFRITGYLSPPSSTACHWSKEFQFVYVNRRCVRRLDFLQKAINNAFAPCMALLAGRGGADGQGIIRRVRDPNASSGQRQELYPVFVLNLECPPDEVDITSEPDKTWVEFSNWPAARNACVAMLLAFLSHFPHAVPNTVLRDLRRAFQRNKCGETWTTASPPPPTRGASRVSPEHAPSPSPSPMRLTAPDLGAFSDVAMPGGVDSCAWMGKEPGWNMMGEEGGEAMEFQGGGIRGGGVLYPSPASRFGARDIDSSRLTAVPFGPIANDRTAIDVPMDVSPHFASHRESRRSPDRRTPDGDRWGTTHSPFFDKVDGQGRYSGRESPQPRQLGLQVIGAVSSYRRGGVRLCSDFEPPVAPASVWCPLVSKFEERAWEDKSGDEPENRARGQQMQDLHGYRRGVSKGWDANTPDVTSQTTPPPPPPPTGAEFGTIGDLQNSRREVCSKEQRTGRRLRGGDSDSPDLLIVTRNSQRGRWLGHPAVAEETRSTKRCKDKMYTVDGGNARSLSRLFDYAFTDKGKGRRQGLDRTFGGSESSRNDEGQVDGRRLDGGDAGGSPHATLPAEVEDAVKAGQDGRRPQSSLSPPLSRDALGAGKEKQTLVGVTVRRAQSPQFGFMDENDRSNGFMAENNHSDARQRCPSWHPDSLNTWRSDEEGSKCVPDGESKADDAGQQVVKGSDHADTTGGYNEGPDTPNTRLVVAGTAASRSVEHSPLAGWAREMPCPEAGTACTPPRSRKRRCPESWTTAVAAPAGTPPPFPLAAAHPTNKGRSNPEEALQPQSRPLDHTRSPGAENGLGLEGGRICAGSDMAGAPHVPDTGDAAWGQGLDASSGTNGESGVMKHADRAGETLTPTPQDALHDEGGRVVTQQMEAGIFAETPCLDSVRNGHANGRVEEDSQRAAGLQLEAGMFADTPRVESVREGEANGRVEEDNQRVAGLHLEVGMFAETPRLDSARAGGATDWVEGRQRLAGLERLDQQHELFVGQGENFAEDETAPDVGATPGTPSPTPEAGSGNNPSGPRDRIVDDAGNTKDCPASTAPACAADVVLAYDQDVLGGDGLADNSCHMQGPYPGSSAFRHLQGSGTNRERGGGVEIEQAMGRRTPVRAAEKPISEVLQAGRDEVGAGAEAVAVTVTPEELAQARVIGQAGRKFVLLRARTGALLCVDQHAADERIKLEDLERQVFGEKKNRRNIARLELDPPETLSVTSSDRELLEQHRKILCSWRFDVEVKERRESHGGAPVAILRAVPVLCGVRMSVQDLMGFLHYLRETVEPGSSAKWLRPPQVQHILNYKACHSAIRFGDLLSRPECVGLIKKLAACARPFSCAHGRPSVVPLCVLGGGASVRVARGRREYTRRRRGGRWSRQA